MPTTMPTLIPTTVDDDGRGKNKISLGGGSIVGIVFGGIVGVAVVAGGAVHGMKQMGWIASSSQAGQMKPVGHVNGRAVAMTEVVTYTGGGISRI